MNLALFVRVIVIVAPAALAQRFEAAEQHAGYPHGSTSVEARHLPARTSTLGACEPGEHARCPTPSFLELTQGFDPG